MQEPILSCDIHREHKIHVTPGFGRIGPATLCAPAFIYLTHLWWAFLDFSGAPVGSFLLLLPCQLVMIHAREGVFLLIYRLRIFNGLYLVLMICKFGTLLLYI